MSVGTSVGPRVAALVAGLWLGALPGAGAALQEEGWAVGRLSPAEIARIALPAVVDVVTYADGRKVGGGSGFLVGPEGLVVTSHHVLEGATRAEVVLHSGETFEALHATAADDRRDLVVLRVAGFDLPVTSLGDSREVAVGEPVVVIGSPLGLASTVSDGIVSAKREFQGRRVLQISAPISSGSSGGPVFDGRGRVVGVLAGYMRKGQNVNFAVPVEHVRALLDLPPRGVPVEVLGRKRVSLLAEGGTAAPSLSLHAVLRGESIPGEETTPWALQPRAVRAEEVIERPAETTDELAGVWEVRELTRVPRTASGLYRGVLVSDGERLRGSFFGSLVSDPALDAGLDADRVRDFEARLDRVGHLTLEGEHGCTYFLHASPDAMTGVYECVEKGRTYDLGAVELRRIRGAGPSGRYRVVERIGLGTSPSERAGEAFLFGLPDGRWLGGVAFDAVGERRVVFLRAGRWTRSGDLTARLGEPSGPRASGTHEGSTLALEYAVGGDEYPSLGTLRGVRTGGSDTR